VVPPAFPLVDDALPGAALLDLLFSLESAVLQELPATRHDFLLVLLLRREQGFERALIRQGRARACGWSSRHRPSGEHLLAVVSWGGVYLDGHWRALPRTGMCSLMYLYLCFVCLAEGALLALTSLALPKLVVSPETTTATCNSTTAASRSACA